MKIKHSKYKNTGLIFELLVKQIAADTLSNRDSAAVKLLKKYFTGSSALVKEFRLYEYILKNKGVSQPKADTIVGTIIEISRKFDRETLRRQKYELIKELKEAYDLDKFFSTSVNDYKALAAVYCLMEAQNTPELTDPQIIVDNKTTILEHLTAVKQNEQDVKDKLIEEYSKYDEDLRILTYKILLEKFNGTYGELLPSQKNLLKEFITYGNSNVGLRKLVNEQIDSIKVAIQALTEKLSDDILKIKLNEIQKVIQPLDNKTKVEDSHIVEILQYHELVSELEKL